jgi:hypothetical protein
MINLSNISIKKKSNYNFIKKINLTYTIKSNHNPNLFNLAPINNPNSSLLLKIFYLKKNNISLSPTLFILYFNSFKNKKILIIQMLISYLSHLLWILIPILLIIPNNQICYVKDHMMISIMDYRKEISHKL